MGIWTPAVEPGSRTRRSWFFDVAVAVAAMLVASTYAYASDLPLWVALTIVVAMAAPLVVRRVWPVPTFACCLIIAAGTGAVAMQVVWSPALAIALYTLAVLRPRREAIVAALLLAGGAVVSSIHIFGSSWLPAGISLVAVIVAATVLGLYIRTRHVLFDQLRERADDLERGRDQQVALAAADERARIAREMHDIVAHHLTVMVALSDGAVAQIASAPERAVAAMRTVSSTGREALGDTRRLLGVLRDPAGGPSEREPLPDLAGLERLIDQVRAAGLHVRYDVHGGPPPGAAPGPQLAIYRVVQEALTNTMKHAGPHATAVVRVRYAADEVGVEIADDGRGTARDPRTGDGRGLIGMRERIEAFGGQTQSGPRAPHGWVVSARMPLAPGPQS